MRNVDLFVHEKYYRIIQIYGQLKY